MIFSDKNNKNKIYQKYNKLKYFLKEISSMSFVLRCNKNITNYDTKTFIYKYRVIIKISDFLTILYIWVLDLIVFTFYLQKTKMNKKTLKSNKKPKNKNLKS